MRIFCAYLTCTLAFLVTITGFFTFAWNLTMGELPGSCVATFLVTYLVIASGVSIGFHRYGTHRSFYFTSVGKWLARPLFLIAGSLALQSSMRFWCVAHHKHHQHTDKDGDPHSPYCPGGSLMQKIRQFLWSHMLWIPHFNHSENEFPQWLKFDWFENLITRLYLLILLTPLTLIWFYLGWHHLAAYLGAIFIYWHVTASVNSVTHLFGQRPFKTGDHSGNMFWLAIFSLGEHLHHNHHNSQKSPCFARRWWEYTVDVGWMQICLLRMFGLVRITPHFNH